MSTPLQMTRDLFSEKIINEFGLKVSRLENAVMKETFKAQRIYFNKLDAGGTFVDNTAAGVKTGYSAGGDASRVPCDVETIRYKKPVKDNTVDITGLNFVSEYAKDAARALNRRKDLIVIAALAGVSTYGKDSDFSASNISWANVVAISKQIAGYCDEEIKGYWVIDSSIQEQLLLLEQVISNDYNKEIYAKTGSLHGAIISGLHIIYLPNLPKADRTVSTWPSYLPYIDGTDGYSFAFPMSAVGLGTAKEVNTKITYNSDSSSDIIEASMLAGACTIEDEKIMRIRYKA